jgi:hypothetical protein
MGGVNISVLSMRLHGVDIDDIISSLIGPSCRPFCIVFRASTPCGIFVLLTYKYRIIVFFNRLVHVVNRTGRGVNADTVPELAWGTE